MGEEVEHVYRQLRAEGESEEGAAWKALYEWDCLPLDRSET